MIARTRRDGLPDLARRMVRRLGQRLDVDRLDAPLFDHDVSDSLDAEQMARLDQLAPRRRHADGPRPLTIGWVCTPPSAGSGGHTTLFRMIEWLESRGHVCVLYLYDRHGGDLARHEAVIRAGWPALRARVVAMPQQLTGLDAVVASSWQTAHVIARRCASRMARLYFVQDYEPAFYPAGATAALAEDSYRFGFRTIALGRMVDFHLSRLGVASDLAPFGCDTGTYRLTNETGPRRGVAFLARPGADRRGYQLGRRALEVFHRSHPDEPIHLYGPSTEPWDIPVIRHGMMAPRDLADLYNGCTAGLALSFSNITLVADELLACGAIPVVNDHPDARLEFDRPSAAWGEQTAYGIARALARVVDTDDPERPRRAAAEAPDGWAATARVVEAALLDETGSAAGQPALRRLHGMETSHGHRLA